MPINRARQLGPVVALIAALVFVTSCGINADNPPTIARSIDGYDIRMEFTSALNLPARAKVLSNGLDVGQVEEVTYEDGSALVKARIKKTVELPADSRAELRQDTMLGEIYVAILPPSEPSQGPMLGPGSLIPLARTEPAANVEDVMRGMSNILGGGELDKIHTAISTLNSSFPKDPQQFDALYRTTLKTVAAVSENTDKLDVMLESVDRTLGVVLADPTGIDRMLRTGGANFSGLGYSLIDVAELIANLKVFAVAAGAIIDPEYERLKETFSAIAPIITAIANSDIYAVTSKATGVIRDKLIPLIGSPDVDVTNVSIDGRTLARGDANSFIAVLRSIGMIP